LNALNYIRNQPPCYPAQTNVMDKVDDILGDIISEDSGQNKDGIVRGIEHETQLVIWQLSKLKQMHKHIKEQILRQECQITADLGQLHPLGIDKVRASDPRRAQLMIRLSQLDDKRQRFAMDFFDRQSRCLERLVGLAGKHRLLTP
jgi:hypothetical protein